MMGQCNYIAPFFIGTFAGEIGSFRVKLLVLRNIILSHDNRYWYLGIYRCTFNHKDFLT